ncbi:MAG: FAD-dependent oxidoreductase [Actinomycetia bacterium]|nr:FAD-dependent oxidoreductase [Actinomycetes bacterium]
MSSADVLAYDAVIIGGGLSGLTTAYLLRNKNVLLLEKEDRFGGRVKSEQIAEMTNNVGTQFFSDEGGFITRLMDELDIERTRHKPRDVPYAFFVEGEYYPTLKSLMGWRMHLDRLKLIALAAPRFLAFLKPESHPKRQKFVAQNIVGLYDKLRPQTKALVTSYMRGACLAKPERTSAGIGSGLMLGVFFMGEASWITGGFQQATDRMAAELGDSARYGVEVTGVENIDGLVRVTYVEDGEEHAATARGAAVTAPAMVVPRIVAGLPEERSKAFERVKYGPLVMVSLIFEPKVPWDRFFALGSDDTVFQIVVDQTFDTPADNPDNPVVCNCIIAQYPDETADIERLTATPDVEIARMALDDLARVVPGAERAREFLRDTTVTRWPIGEIELSPEYYTELLPHIPEPLGNIHFAGDYTHPMSFVDGAVLSAVTAARALGSDQVTDDDDGAMKLASLLFRR